MVRSYLTIFLLFSACLSAIAAEPSGNTFIVPEEERSDVETVVVDSSNILEEDFSGKESFRRVPADSFAGVLGRPAKNIRWYPAADPNNPNRTMIRETSQSFDNSVIVFTENTGKREGPNGTRLIFVDTVNLIVLRRIELPFWIQEVRCQGSSGKVWYLRKAQPDQLRDSSGFGILDVRSGEILTEQKLETLPKRMYPHITGKYAWILEDEKVFHLYPNGEKKLFLDVPGAAELKVSPDGLYLAIITGKDTRLYSAINGKLVYKVNLVPGLTFVFLGGDPPRLLIGVGNSGFKNLSWPETLYMVSKGSPRYLFNNLSGPVVSDPSGRAFYAIKPKNRIEKLDSVSGKYMSSSIVTSLKPDTPGRPEQLYQAMESGFFIIYDSVGGLNKIDAIPRRWRKLGMMRPWTE